MNKVAVNTQTQISYLVHVYEYFYMINCLTPIVRLKGIYICFFLIQV